MKGSGLAVAVAGRASPLAAARILWRFSRPHTLIVTTTSIVGIYVIAAETLPGAAIGNGLGDLALTLVAGALVNLYIVGLNQCEDVEIDRVNKPGLPIPAGLLSVRAAWWLVSVSGLISLAMALTQGWVETVAVGAALAIGTAYSSPPFRLKRFPAVAAASISLVRAAVVNVGVYLHFASTLGGRPGLSELPGPVVALTLFVLPFSFAIAVLKDIPDAEGDRRYRIATFTVRLGARAAFLMGMTALAGAYLGMIVAAPLLLDDASAAVLVAGHAACLAVLLWLALRVDLTERVAFTRFYLRVWALFFAEYLLMPLAVAVA